LKLDYYSLDRFPFLNTVILKSRLAWSIRLRWLAVIGYFLATIITEIFFEISLPYKQIWIVLFSLAFLNLIYQVLLWIIKEFSFTAEIITLHIHIIIDLICLTLLIHFSGGIENPVYLFYIFHIVISSILFLSYSPFMIATLVVILFYALVYLEYNEIIPHYCLYEISIHNSQLAVVLILIVFFITVYVTEYICTTFMRIYRDSKRIIDKQNKQLIEADKDKTRFFQFASHELKAPVIAIKSTLDGITKSFAGSLDPKVLDLLRRASMRSAQLLTILKELLELSQKRNVKPILENEQININKILNDTIEREKTSAEQKNIKLNLNLTNDNISTCGKQEDFEKIFSNLINNAIRYSPNGGEVEITIKIENSNIIFEVKDNGIGISEEDIPKIFEEFYRSELAKKVINFGTGLGLSLVKQIVENYNGMISVTSKVNLGSTFKVSIPIKTC
jgi:signal transduction histidine kinase